MQVKESILTNTLQQIHTDIYQCLHKCSWLNKFHINNPLTTDDAFWRRQFLATCYQLAQYVLKIGSCASRKGGTGGGGWVHCFG